MFIEHPIGDVPDVEGDDCTTEFMRKTTHCVSASEILVVFSVVDCFQKRNCTKFQAVQYDLGGYFGKLIETSLRFSEAEVIKRS